MPILPTGTVTFLFTDIEGSSRLWEADAPAMHVVLARHDDLVRAAIGRHSGLVFKTVGDAFYSVFTGPSDALAAALEIERALAAEDWGGAEGPLVRAALHTGTPELRDDDYFGPPLNRVARLIAAGHGGQVLLSSATAALVRDTLPDGVHLRDLGEQHLRDLRAPERVYQLVAPGLRTDFPPLRSVTPGRQPLPLPLSGLVNRARERQAARALLEDERVRVLTLTGPGGVGKTRIALHIADEMRSLRADGAVFVPLGSVSDPGHVASTIAQSLGVRQRGERTPLELLRDELRDRELLLVLDNFEQVLDAAALVPEMCAAAPRLQVLVTSRERLRIGGERELAIHPLAVPGPSAHPSRDEVATSPAVQLFVQQARSYRHDFALSEETVPVVAEICRRLDGLPLAIELAAARTKVLTAPALLRRLERRLSVLTGGARDLPDRQRTMRDTIAWSFDLLDSQEQALLRRLAVFARGSTLEAAEAVCDPGKDLGLGVLDGIGSLVDKSLIQQNEEGGESRFRMLETIREYLAEKLVEAGEEAAIRTAHLRYYRRMAQEAFFKLQGPEQFAWLAQLEAEIDNIRGALEWSLSGPRTVANGLTLAANLVLFWWQNGHLSEGRTWLDRLLAAADEPSEARTAALLAAAQLAISGAGYRAARPYLQECVAVSRSSSFSFTLPIALAMFGAILPLDGEGEAAKEAGDEALASVRRLQMPILIAQVLFWHGRIAYLIGDLDSADQSWHEGLDLLRDSGDHLLSAGLIGRLGDLAYRRGDLGTARRRCQESTTLWRRMGNSAGVGQELATLGRVALAAGDADESVRYFRESLAHARAAGSRVEIPLALSGLAASDLARGRLGRAALLFGAADALGDVVGLAGGDLYPGEYDERLPVLRRTMGESLFEEAFTVGRAWSFDHAVGTVLEASDEVGECDRLPA